jgi:hypothetical protein
MYSHSSFLLRGSTSTLERCGDTESTNSTKLTLFSDEQATKASSFPLSGGIGGTDRNPYTEVGAQLHNSIRGSQQKTTKLLHGGSFEVTSVAQSKFHGGWVGENQITWIGL